MDLDFDKEIDNLLRQAARSGFVSADAPEHLDADEISAFAENALPEKNRAAYVRHFADCDRCRKILSNLILLNAEAANETASVAVTASEIKETKSPWYRKIFALPKLAYVMSGLAVLFGGLLGVLILQNSMQNREAPISQVETEKIGGGPNAAAVENYSNSSAMSNANIMSFNSAANLTTNSNQISSNSTVAKSADTTTAESRAVGEVSSADDKDKKVQTNEPAPSDSATGVAAQKPEAERKSAAKEKNESVTETQPAEDDAPMTRAAPPAVSAASPPSPKTAKRDTELSSEKKRSVADEERNDGAAATRQIGGKTFNRRDGVFYDAAYQNQNTINVRRGTDQYRKLDSGLRSIGDKLNGTVVVVWKGKAYRIQ